MFQRLLPVAAALAALPAILTASPATAGGCRHHECYEKVRRPEVYATVAKPYVVAPARAEVVRLPAVYGSFARQVEVAPARAHYITTPAVYGVVNRDVVIQPAGFRWERRVNRHGREELCKVHMPAVTRTVSERVILQAPQRVLHYTPAIHRDVQRTIVLQEPARRTIHHPAVLDYAHHRVMVQPAGWQWQRSR